VSSPTDHSPYVSNHSLFSSHVFERFLKDSSFPRERVRPDDVGTRLSRLLEIWEKQRLNFVRDQDGTKSRAFVGLPTGAEPVKRSESEIENSFIRPLLEDVLGYSVEQNRSLRLTGLGQEEYDGKSKRPDVVAFADDQAHALAVAAANEIPQPPDGPIFCRRASLILDAKRFDKGVGVDEEVEKVSKHRRSEPTAIEDVIQVERYLRGCRLTWGVLTNGRSWRLMRVGHLHEHLRFDLVLFLEELRKKQEGPDSHDLDVFNLFFHLFGPPGSAGGYLDALFSESSEFTSHVREVLRKQAHAAVEEIARGFWRCAANSSAGLDTAPNVPSQEVLDHLREVSLTLFYRLLFVLKAEAQGLLAMTTDSGGWSDYARLCSSKAIFDRLAEDPASDRKSFSVVYEKLLTLFRGIDQGDVQFDIPAYNGGLFDPDRHPELEKWRLLDDSLFNVLKNVIYLEGGEQPVPYADLNVRDLGDIYEGLLELRLVARHGVRTNLVLKNEKGERKASGSYFTPDSIVDYLVRRGLRPLLDAAGADAFKVLQLRILDPAMGSGHFLVKAVDVIADHLTIHCDPAEEEAPRDNGPDELAYWKRKVVENCVYGVDFNPMAVELARVALWLHTADYGKPLSFLDHHFKVGNSLVGAELGQLSHPGLKSRKKKSGLTWVPQPIPRRETTQPLPKGKKRRKRTKKTEAYQLSLPLPIDTELFSGILKSIQGILLSPSETASDVRNKRKNYIAAVSDALAAHRLLADLWCLQWFIGSPDGDSVEAFDSPIGLYSEVKRICGVPGTEERAKEIADLEDHPLVAGVRQIRASGYGPRPLAFFHWQLEFPEVAFADDGTLREGFGFDAVVGNPPWDRIRPERRHFYGPHGRPEDGPEWDVANTQARSLDVLIAKLHEEEPQLEQEWHSYEAGIVALKGFLSSSDIYRHQAMSINGTKTGGDPDLFRYFTERAFHCVGEAGRVALVVPSTLWQAEGCSALRHLMLDSCKTEEIFVFENYRKWAFDIHSSFKFTTFVTQRGVPGSNHLTSAAFMMRDARVLSGTCQERIVSLDRAMIEGLSPETLALLDFRDSRDAELLAALAQAHPSLMDAQSGWHPKYRRELDMTNDAWRFRTRRWMKDRGFLQVLDTKGEDGEWHQQRIGGSPTARYPESLPAGGEYWIAADADWYRTRGYVEKQIEVDKTPLDVFIEPDDAKLPALRKVEAEFHSSIIAGARYTPLYEGRMVQLHDPAAKAYVRGEGRQAVWEGLPYDEKRLIPRVFVPQPTASSERPGRIAFCDVTGATNERTALASLIGNETSAGNSVPTLAFKAYEQAGLMLAALGSFVADFQLRHRVHTHLNLTQLSRLPVPPPSDWGPHKGEILELVSKLNCLIPEAQDFWNAVRKPEWTRASLLIDPWERGLARARIDAICAEVYGLSVSDYARILTHFPLLDRNEPALEGDRFVTESDKKPNGEEGSEWEVADGTYVEMKPRSFITRDLALLTYMVRKKVPPPQRLDVFFREQVGMDPKGEPSRFRIGVHRDLQDRVHLARKLGAVPYVPSDLRLTN